jgi:hypothetical protein
MQLSVIPHLTIYGDVQKSQLKKPALTATFEKILQLTSKQSSEIALRPELSEKQKTMIQLTE